MNEVSFNTCKFKRSEDATTSSGNRSFTLREVTVRDMAVIESEFVTPVRFEGVAAADVSFNETSINQFHCHSPPIARKRGGDPKIEYFSGFNDTAFQKVTFFDKVFCDRTDWKGFFMGNVTFHADADFSNSQFLDLYWDKVDMETVDGSCLELDFSKSYIERRVLANTTIDCKANFEETTFETVFIKRFYGKLPNFKNAMFVNQEFVDGHCCSTACRPLRCLCNVSEPSGQCPVGYKDVNVSALTGCFPAHATVERHDGLVVTMEELAYAEKIAIGAGQQSDVFFFGHRSSDDVAEFVSIRHASTVKPLLLSAQHYLYVNGKLTTAETVRPGDRLRGPDGEDDLFVTEVDREQHRGLYAPTSIHGDLLVDGVVVSSYTSAIHPGLAHKLLHPLRLLYRYGFDSVVSRFTMLHERSWEHLPRALGIPLGPDRV